METTKNLLAPVGQLNPVGTMDKSKRQQSSKNSEARKDNAFRPVEWTFSPMEEALVAVHETDRRAGRGIIVRDEPLKEEFQIRYNKGSKGLVGSINTGIIQSIT